MTRHATIDQWYRIGDFSIGEMANTDKFASYRIFTGGEVFANCQFQRNGCSDFQIYARGFHFCKRSEMSKISEVLQYCYDLASKKPGWNPIIIESVR